jgi:hypothetical protein
MNICASIIVGIIIIIISIIIIIIHLIQNDYMCMYAVFLLPISAW